MIKNMTLRRVGLIPPCQDMEEGVLYLCDDYAVAIHLCCCGCKNEVVTGLLSNGWKLDIKGDNFSLSPSIFNSGMPCKSHYYITNNEVRRI